MGAGEGDEPVKAWGRGGDADNGDGWNGGGDGNGHDGGGAAGGAVMHLVGKAGAIAGGAAGGRGEVQMVGFQAVYGDFIAGAADAGDGNAIVGEDAVCGIGQLGDEDGGHGVGCGEGLVQVGVLVGEAEVVSGESDAGVFHSGVVHLLVHHFRGVIGAGDGDGDGGGD